MKYLVVGSGGREHTLAWRLRHDGSAQEVYVLPGNGGIDEHYRVAIDPKDHEKVIAFCNEKKIDYVIVGPEAPLVDGLVDSLEQAGFKVFGPSAKAAQLEGSKLFAKMIMEKYHVPTAAHHDFTTKQALLDHIKQITTYPIVIKLDGLAAGKGVAIPESQEEALAFVEEYVTENAQVFVEEHLKGEEASVLGISDGTHVYPFIAAQDHKRIFDGDKGPNTGGMGAYAPAPVIDDAKLEKVRKEVLQPVVDGMRSEGIPFKGILYAGLMVEGDDIKVLEFNVRFGDPEAQVILPLLDVKLGDLIQHAIEGTLQPEMIRFKQKHAITVVLASGGYPGSYEKGKEISGIDDVSKEAIVFHAGTEQTDDRLVTSGGRVLAVTAMGDTLTEASEHVYREVRKIQFEDAFYRKDIGHKAL